MGLGASEISLPFPLISKDPKAPHGGLKKGVSGTVAPMLPQAGVWLAQHAASRWRQRVEKVSVSERGGLPNTPTCGRLTLGVKGQLGFDPDVAGDERVGPQS